MKKDKAKVTTPKDGKQAATSSSALPSAKLALPVHPTSKRLLERRKNPKISAVAPPKIAPAKLTDYEPIVGRPELEELYFLARKLKGKTLKMVNSTALGGGVAELLTSLVPMLNELGIAAKWEVITGNSDFFEVTKAIHNALQGGKRALTEQDKQVFIADDEQNRQNLKFEEDFVVIHDPQPVGLIASKPGTHAKWIWRCHIDLSNPNPAVWDFLRPWVEKYDATIFSSPAFARQLPVPQYLFYPCIDPLSEKNKHLDETYVQKICDDFGIDRSRPIVTQVSRFDRLKDPVGVVQAYKLARQSVDCQLVLAGGSASDDPEGAAVLKEVQNAAGNDPDIIILNLPPWSALEINALQRASTLIVQKSLREGFGLTVTEALWKAKPVIAGDVGGIPSQVIHKLTGMLVHSVEECADQIQYLLTNPEFAAELGKNGREHVKENFLMSSNAKRWMLLFHILMGLT
jgi:trehalose synthase